jgi:transcriptional regulator NrdR family protein
MTYVIRSNGRKEEFDGEKLISSIMAAASNADLVNDPVIQAIIKNVTSNTISYAQNQEEVQSKTLKDAILSQLLRIGIQMAIQKFGANVSKENVINELINAGLQMSSKSSKASSSNDILAELLGAGLQMSSKSSKASSSNVDLDELLKTGMKLANAWMAYNKTSGGR